MKQQDWTDNIRQRLSDYEVPVPEGLWNDIEQRLPQRRARRVPLLRWLPAAAACALLLVALRLISPSDSATSPQVAHTPTPPSAPARPIPEPGQDESSDNKERNQETIKESNRYIAKHQVKIETEETTALPHSASDDSPTTEGETDTEETAAQPTSPPTHPSQVSTHGYAHQPVSRPAGRSHSRRGPSVTMHASNLMAYGDHSKSEPLQMTRSFMGPASHQLASQGPVYLADHRENTDHHTPLTLGLSVRQPLWQQWWLATGADYVRATSTFTLQAYDYTLTNQQRLHYVGLPLSAGYSFWQSPRLGAYASAGAEALFNVKAQVDNGHLGRDRVQFSFLLSAGAEYQLMPHVSFYVQPGLRYYPDNGSAVQNIFKERPWQFDLQLGLRLTVN